MALWREMIVVTKSISSTPLIKSNMAPILARLSASSAFFRPSVPSIRGARIEKTSMCWPEQNLEEDGDGMEKTSRHVLIDTDQVYTLQPAGWKSSSALLTPPQDQGWADQDGKKTKTKDKDKDKEFHCHLPIAFATVIANVFANCPVIYIVIVMVNYHRQCCWNPLTRNRAAAVDVLPVLAYYLSKICDHF